MDGEPTLTTEGTVGPYPSKIPMIDVVTVGAGGGLDRLDLAGGHAQGRPASAGADPGPLCYGKGGTEPTITDAHVVLGRIRRTCWAARSRWTSRRPARGSPSSPPTSG